MVKKLVVSSIAALTLMLCIAAGAAAECWPGPAENTVEEGRSATLTCPMVSWEDLRSNNSSVSYTYSAPSTTVTESNVASSSCRPAKVCPPTSTYSAPSYSYRTISVNTGSNCVTYWYCR